MYIVTHRCTPHLGMTTCQHNAIEIAHCICIHSNEMVHNSARLVHMANINFRCCVHWGIQMHVHPHHVINWAFRICVGMRNVTRNCAHRIYAIVIYVKFKHCPLANVSLCKRMFGWHCCTTMQMFCAKEM